MTESANSRLRRPVRTGILLLLGVLAAVCAVMFWMLGKEDPGEYVSDDTPGSPAVTRNGVVYWWDNPGGRVIIRSLSLRIGKRRQIASVSQRDGIATRLHPSGEWLYFTESEKPGSGFYGTAGEIPPRDGFLGNFLLDSDGRERDTERVTGKTAAIEGRPGHLKRVRFTDGYVESIRVDTGGYPLQFLEYCVEGDTLYWRKSGSRSKVTASPGSTNWIELPADCKLMASPIGGGSARIVAGGLTESSRVWSDEGFVFWTTPRVFPARALRLMYLRTRDGRMGEIPGSANGMTIKSFGGKLYWPTVDSAGAAESINEKDPDTGQARSIVRMQGWWLASSSMNAVRSAGDHLYTLLTPRENPGKFSRDARWLGNRPPRPGRSLLARIDPARPQDLSRYRELPSTFDAGLWLDGEYAYFGAKRRKQSLLEYASGAPVVHERSLHRISLP